MAYPPPMHGAAVMVPYLGVIPGGLVIGKKISIHGMVPHTCSRFAVNLQCGPNVNPRDDIALHMSFRYDVPAPYVVRNSLQMMQWGLEEAHGYLSFGRGHTFEIKIHVEHDHFKIYFNDNHFTDFRYRHPIMRINHLAIDGEVVIHSIRIDGYEIHGHYSQPHRPAQMGYGQPMVPPPPIPMAHVYPVYPMGGIPPSAAIPIAGAMGAAMGATVVRQAEYHHMDKNAKKAMKKHKKEMKKAMKHHKHAKHSHHGMYGYGHHKHHGSSSSSSSSEEE